MKFYVVEKSNGLGFPWIEHYRGEESAAFQIYNTMCNANTDVMWRIREL